MNYLKKRLREGSTWAGLAAATVGLGEAFKINEAAQVADAIAGAGAQLVTGNYVGASLAIVLGIAAALIKDKD